LPLQVLMIGYAAQHLAGPRPFHHGHRPTVAIFGFGAVPAVIAALAIFGLLRLEKSRKTTEPPAPSLGSERI
jgi:hypothetical protein